MRRIALLLVFFGGVLSCQPEEEVEFTEFDLSVKTEIQGSKKNNATKRIRIRNIKALRKLPFPNIKNRKEVHVLGYYEPGDGGGGNFYWDSLSVENDNGGTIIISNKSDIGRWKRIFEEPVSVKWFGAKGDGINDDTEHLQRAFLLEKKVELPKTDKFYFVKGTLTVKSDLYSEGGVLYSNQPGVTLLEIKADNITLEGLRVMGNDTVIGQESYYPDVTTGISIKNYNSLTIVNCEIAGWSYAGIQLYNSKNNYVNENYIHHNRRKGLGYGISLHNEPFVPTNAVINCNYFEYNRHDIAGSGNEKISYEASYNIVGSEGGEGQHRFDMHGKNGGLEVVAGTDILIHHNTFMSDRSFAIVIRGVPENRMEIYSNTFAHEKIDNAFKQLIMKKVIDSRNYVNIWIGENKFEKLDLSNENEIIFEGCSTQNKRYNLFN